MEKSFFCHNKIIPAEMYICHRKVLLENQIHIKSTETGLAIIILKKPDFILVQSTEVGYNRRL